MATTHCWKRVTQGKTNFGLNSYVPWGINRCQRLHKSLLSCSGKPGPFWRTYSAAAATVHRLKKRSQPCGPETSNPKRCPIVPLLTFPEKSLPAQVVYPHPDSQYCPIPFCPLCMYAVPFGTKVIHVVMCTVGVWQEEGPVTHQHYRTVHALAAGRCKVDSTLTGAHPMLKGWVHRRCTTLGSRRGGHDEDQLRGAHLRARSVWQWCACPICIAHSRTQGGVRVRLILRPLPLNWRFIYLAESPAARVLSAPRFACTSFTLPLGTPGGGHPPIFWPNRRRPRSAQPGFDLPTCR